jgi:hypothetical protein
MRKGDVVAGRQGVGVMVVVVVGGDGWWKGRRCRLW